MAKQWCVQARDDHFAVLAANGDEIVTSKDYANKASAQRAARNFIAAMQRGVVLEFIGADGEPVREFEEAGEESSTSMPSVRITPPVPGRTRYAQTATYIT